MSNYLWARKAYKNSLWCLVIAYFRLLLSLASSTLHFSPDQLIDYHTFSTMIASYILPALLAAGVSAAPSPTMVQKRDTWGGALSLGPTYQIPHSLCSHDPHPRHGTSNSRWRIVPLAGHVEWNWGPCADHLRELA